jgi:hypothetical protein
MPYPQIFFLVAWLGSGGVGVILGLVAVRLTARRMRTAEIPRAVARNEELVAA